MIAQIIGYVLSAGSLVSFGRAIQLAISLMSKAWADRAATNLLAEHVRDDSAADTRRRLDRCEEQHRTRDERDDALARETAAELGRMRGQIVRLAECIHDRARVNKARTRRGKA